MCITDTYTVSVQRVLRACELVFVSHSCHYEIYAVCMYMPHAKRARLCANLRKNYRALAAR
jgi:hypothetical protein